MDPKGIKIFRHRYGAGTTPIELNERMQAVSVTKDISGKEDMQLSMIGSFEEPQHVFTPGDFVTLEDQSGVTWSWGRVSVVRSTLKREIAGPLVHAPYAVMAQGWYDFLSRSKIHVMQVAERPSVGTLFKLADWKRIGEEISGMVTAAPGAILQHMLKRVMRIKLPESLGGGWFADEIPVVYDRDTALRYAPEFADIEPVDFGSLMPQLAMGFMETRSTDVGSLIASMFLFETSLVELVPYLSTADVPASIPLSNQSTPSTPSPPGTPISGQQRTLLGAKLGAQPVLVFRMKPFRADPLYAAAVSKIHYRPEDVEAGYLDRQLALYDEPTRRRFIQARMQARNDTTEKLFDQGMFSQITFNPTSIATLPYSYINSISRQRSDTERLNAATINAVPAATPEGTTLTDIDYLALPVAIDNQIENHGLRLRVARWNLYPPAGTQQSNDYSTYYRAVAAQVMQFYEKAYLYETGSLTMPFVHTLYFVESETRQQSTYDRAVIGLEPGRWFRTSFAGLNNTREPTPEPPPAGAVILPRAPSDEYYGYITSVTHSVQRMPSGFLTANTQVNFQRGHFSEMWDILHGINVPLGDVDKPLGGSKGGRGTRPSGDRSACSRAKAKSPHLLSPICAVSAITKPVLDTFNSGNPITSFAGNWPGSGNLLWERRDMPPAPVVNPTTPEGAGAVLAQHEYNNITYKFLPEKPPAWLYCWFLSACSVMDSAQYNEMKALVDATPASTDVVRRSRQATVWGLAACAYVIECYWRSKSGYDAVQLRIASLQRAIEAGFHKVYAAMDFYLEFPADFKGEEPGVFQMWAALTRLADAGRIPYGGRGLYVNVNPTTGVSGTAPYQANSASGRFCGHPYGGSSWTHYDIRGMWGISVKRNSKGTIIPAEATTWLATDWDGDGHDEFTEGSAYPQKNLDRAIEEKKSGVVDLRPYVLANIADPAPTQMAKPFQILRNYTGDTDRAKFAKTVSAIITARMAATGAAEIEAERAPVRDEIFNYYLEKGRGKRDRWLHEVTAKVPNMMQVYSILDIISSQPVPTQPTPPRVEPDNRFEPSTINRYGPIFISKNENEDPVSAPTLYVFGGSGINNSRPSNYMRPYVEQFIGPNHVFIASRDDIDYEGAQEFVRDELSAVTYTPRVLYIFSNGVKPIGTSPPRMFSGSDQVFYYQKIYLADAFLGSGTSVRDSITARFVKDMQMNTERYVFFYSDVYTDTGNGMTQATRNTIMAIPGLEKIFVPRDGRSPLDAHLHVNTVATAHLRNSGLLK